MLERITRDYNTFVFQGKIEPNVTGIRMNATSNGGMMYELPIKMIAENSTVTGNIGGYRGENLTYYSFKNKRVMQVSKEDRFNPEIVNDTFTVTFDYETDADTRNKTMNEISKALSLDTQEARNEAIGLINSERDNYIEFIDPVEAGETLAENLDWFADKVVRVTGQLEFTYSSKSNRIFTNYVIDTIRIVEDNAPQFLETREVMYLNKDSLNTDNAMDTGEIEISGWVLDQYYNSTTRQNELKYFERDYVIDVSDKVKSLKNNGDGLTESEGQKIIAIINLLKVEDDKYYGIPVRTNVIVGSQVATAELTDTEKQFAELGMLTASNNIVTQYIEKNIIHSFDVNFHTNNLTKDSSFREGKVQVKSTQDFWKNIIDTKEVETIQEKSLDDNMAIGTNEKAEEVAEEPIANDTKSQLEAIFGGN